MVIIGHTNKSTKARKIKLVFALKGNIYDALCICTNTRSDTDNAVEYYNWISLQGRALLSSFLLQWVSLAGKIDSTEQFLSTEKSHMRMRFLEYRIRIPACFTWTDNSYLTHVISPRTR